MCLLLACTKGWVAGFVDILLVLSDDNNRNRVESSISCPSMFLLGLGYSTAGVPSISNGREA